jgi:hypothetical protein
MPIARKPNKNNPATPNVDEQKVQEAIFKGGSVAGEAPTRQELRPTKRMGRPKKQKEPEQSVVLTIPVDLLQKIDELVADRLVKTSRRAWIMEAIAFQLESELRSQYK